MRPISFIGRHDASRMRLLETGLEDARSPRAKRPSRTRAFRQRAGARGSTRPHARAFQRCIGFGEPPSPSSLARPRGREPAHEPLLGQKAVHARSAHPTRRRTRYLEHNDEHHARRSIPLERRRQVRRSHIVRRDDPHLPDTPIRSKKRARFVRARTHDKPIECTKIDIAQPDQLGRLRAFRINAQHDPAHNRPFHSLFQFDSSGSEKYSSRLEAAVTNSWTFCGSTASVAHASDDDVAPPDASAALDSSTSALEST